MSHDNIVLAHLSGAATVWDYSGMFASTLWAENSQRRIIAVPTTPEAAAILADEQVWMLAWMSDVIAAEVIGRTDEAWTRTFIEPQPLRPGDLNLLQETDPEVRTALIVQSINLADGEMLCGIATSAVNDFGHRSWNPMIVRMVDQSMADTLHLARQMAAQFEDHSATVHSRHAHLASVFHDLGWELSLC